MMYDGQPFNWLYAHYLTRLSLPSAPFSGGAILRFKTYPAQFISLTDPINDTIRPTPIR